MDHYHVMSRGMDLVGGKCATQEEAEDMVRRLNEGKEYLLGSLSDVESIGAFFSESTFEEKVADALRSALATDVSTYHSLTLVQRHRALCENVAKVLLILDERGGL
jgi:hypothetical protein